MATRRGGDAARGGSPRGGRRYRLVQSRWRVAIPGLDIEQRIRRELPHLSTEVTADLACAVSRLVEVFHPERVYVYGSQARGAARRDSDIDMMVVVGRADEPTYRLDQRGYEVLEPYRLPIELLFITRDEFERRLPVVMSLPATVAREGRLLYDATTVVAERPGGSARLD